MVDDASRVPDNRYCSLVYIGKCVDFVQYDAVRNQTSDEGASYMLAHQYSIP